MSKKNKIIYWVATSWLALGMVSTGWVQLFKVQGKIEYMIDLGYPVYFLMLIGAWKILGSIVVLIPKFPLLKEWAYAGFFFVMSGAIFSHWVTGKSLNEIFPALLLLILTAVSWYFRPAARRFAVMPPR